MTGAPHHLPRETDDAAAVLWNDAAGEALLRGEFALAANLLRRAARYVRTQSAAAVLLDRAREAEGLAPRAPVGLQVEGR